MKQVQSPIMMQVVNASPTQPQSGYILLYVKSDNALYIMLSNGTEKKIS